MNEIDRDSWIYQFPGPAIGQVFSGNKELAKSYLGVGMVMLFYVKTTMRNGLLGSLSMNRTLEDGTTIHVNSFYGQDRIMIDAPVLPVVIEEEKREFQFKFTASGGTILTGDDENITYGVTFFVNDYKANVVYRGVYPYQPTDHNTQMLVFYNKDTKIWTLRKRATLPSDGINTLQADMDDVTGDYFDQNTHFLVSYSFMTNKGGTINYISTQYPGVFYASGDHVVSSGIWNDTRNAIVPNYYEDVIISFASYLLPPEEEHWFHYRIELPIIWDPVAYPDWGGYCNWTPLLQFSPAGTLLWKQMCGLFLMAMQRARTEYDALTGPGHCNFDLWTLYSLSFLGLEEN